MKENWKKILIDEEQKRKNEIENQNEENENTKNKIEELKKSLPEIKKKIIELNNFFSNYTIEIEEPVIDGREDTYAQIKWVLKFYQGKKDLFSTVHFKKNIEGFSFIQNPKIQDSKTYEENKDREIYWLSGDGPLDQAQSFKTFDEMWERFVFVYSRFINDCNKETSYDYKKDVELENKIKLESIENNKELKRRLWTVVLPWSIIFIYIIYQLYF